MDVKEATGKAESPVHYQRNQSTSRTDPIVDWFVEYFFRFVHEGGKKLDAVVGFPNTEHVQRLTERML